MLLFFCGKNPKRKMTPANFKYTKTSVPTSLERVIALMILCIQLVSSVNVVQNNI